MLTQSRLKEVLHYDPSTGIFSWCIATSNRVKIGAISGWIESHGYRVIRIDWKRYLAHRLAWLWITASFPESEIDHINHDPLDNRFVNLREVDHKENHKNRSMQSNNTSGTLGVHWYKARNKWRPRIRVDGKELDLGYYESLEDAITARQAASLKYGFHQNHGSKI